MNARSLLQAKPLTGPDVQVLVISGSGSEDELNLTYAGVIPPSDVRRDLAALIESGNWRLHNVTVTNAALPMAGVIAPPMTSVSFTTSGAAPVGQNYFSVDRIITALKNYKVLAVTYIMSPQFQFGGLRSYSDRYVQVNLAQSGASYTYHVTVVDNSFTRLVLPTVQIVPTAIATSSSEDGLHSTWWRIMGVVLVTCIAAGVGFGVYTVLVRLQ